MNLLAPQSPGRTDPRETPVCREEINSGYCVARTTVMLARHSTPARLSSRFYINPPSGTRDSLAASAARPGEAAGPCGGNKKGLA